MCKSSVAYLIRSGLTEMIVSAHPSDTQMVYVKIEDELFLALVQTCHSAVHHPHKVDCCFASRLTFYARNEK